MQKISDRVCGQGKPFLPGIGRCCIHRNGSSARYDPTNTEDTLTAGEQNFGESWDADVMIRNAKALQRVV